MQVFKKAELYTDARKDKENAYNPN